VWVRDRELIEDLHIARRAARQQTGLTARRIDQWEDAGRDYSTYPDLDTKARELAGAYPALEIGPGYTNEGGPDDTNYAGRRWGVRAGNSGKPKPRHPPDILRRAAEMVAPCPADALDSFGPMTFSAERWGRYLARKGIPWPRLESGGLALDDDTFREMARAYPVEVSPIRELRHALSQMRLNELAGGAGGRNRVLLSVFGSRAGREQARNSPFDF